MATIRRTGGADFPDQLKALVSGPPKSGKTTLLGTVPNIIIADTEPRANNLASLAHLNVPYVTINGTSDLRELQMVLSNDSLRAAAAADAGMPRIDAVAIDTLDTLQKILKKERMDEQRTTKFVRDDWAWLKEEMLKIVEAFTSLPLHVIFTVHLKTQDVGTEKNPQTKVLPGLEGAIATEIAGMVGYSLLSFRRSELDAASGQMKTKYFLQAEGDETYDFLGTRTAGRLPSIITPDFGEVYRAAMAGRPTAVAPAPAPLPTPAAPVVQGQVVPPQQPAPAQPPAQEVQQPAAQPAQAAEPVQATGPDVGPAQAPVQAPQTAAPANPADRPADDEPVNDIALQHVKKVYDALQIAFPEDVLRTKTLGDARNIARMWGASQEDEAGGKLATGRTARDEMLDYLNAMGLMPSTGTEAPQAEAPVEAKLGGTVAEAKAYVGDGTDLAKVNEAYAYELANGNRKSLVSWLESKGATPATPAQPAGPVPGEGVQTAVQNPFEGQQQPVQPQAPAPAQQAPAQPAPAAQPVQQSVQQPVTPQAAPADAPATGAPTEQQATQAVEQGLGGTVIDETINADALCEADGCGKPIDDQDIAKISKVRYNKVLCVDHYIAHGKA